MRNWAISNTCHDPADARVFPAQLLSTKEVLRMTNSNGATPALKSRAASQRMEPLIDDRLRLSGITRSQMRHVPVDLSALAHHVVCELQKINPDRCVGFVVEPRSNDSTPQASFPARATAWPSLNALSVGTAAASRPRAPSLAAASSSPSQGLKALRENSGLMVEDSPCMIKVTRWKRLLQAGA
jgi:hypothetical protein